jgi:hypothetical protein
MRRFLGEPLLHFFLLGAVLFFAYGLVSGPGSAPDEIVVSAGRVEHLAATYARTWQRQPTKTELKGLVDDWVREEIANREAMALGLDKDDTVIRRRLRQKLEFMSEDLVALVEPTDAELSAFLRAHPEMFRVEPRYTFSQVYLDPQLHGDKLARDAARMLAELNAAGDQADISTMGDSLLLEQSYRSLSPRDVAVQFGEGFAARLAGIEPGKWQGPIESGYGVHLVLVSERTDGAAPELAAVRDDVRREWENARRLENNRKVYEDLLKRYTVTIEAPTPAKESQR